MSRVRFIHACAILSIGTPLRPRVAFYGRRVLYGRRINGQTGAARAVLAPTPVGTADFHQALSAMPEVRVLWTVKSTQHQ